MATGDSADQSFQRAGNLVPTVKSFQRTLLPYERELCAAIGCSVEEYKQYLAQLEKYSYIRPAAYDHIPDIQNVGPEWAIVISLVIGLASTAASYFLAPKPRALSDDRGGSRSINAAGRRGTDRFIQSTSFDGFADLAEFGEAVPIIWTRYTGTTGGVVVAPLLVWSRAYSLGTQQAAKLVYIIGESGISPPDLAGIFIGNTSLSVQDPSNYVFNWDGRPNYNASIITQRTEASIGFSACLTPSNSTLFGVSNPIANCTGYRTNWKVVSYPEDVDDNTENDIRNERRKICGFPDRNAGMPGTGRNYPRRLGVVTGSRGGTGSVFKISARRLPRQGLDFQSSTTVSLEDINDALDSECVAADEALQVGERLIVGETLVTVVSRSSGLWTPDNDVDVVLSAPVKGAPLLDIANDEPISNRYSSIHYPVCRATLAVFRNNRRCETTEIGIKSQVWGRVNGLASLNQVPDPEQLSRYDGNNVQFSLGTDATYFLRISMFRVQMRQVGETSWANVGGVLAVRGSTPTDQHFQVRVNHGTAAAYEFQMMPVSSGAIRDGLSEVILLDNNAATIRDGMLATRGTRQSIFTDSGRNILNQLFNSGEMQKKGWGNAYVDETYILPLRGEYFNMAVFSSNEAGATDYTGRLINVSNEQEQLKRAFLDDVFGSLSIQETDLVIKGNVTPIVTILGGSESVKTEQFKVETDRGFVRIRMRVRLKTIKEGQRIVDAYWDIDRIDIVEARPIAQQSFATDQTIAIKRSLRTDSPFLRGKFPRSIEDNFVGVRMRIRIIDTEPETFTPEQRGWRLFDPFAAFAEVSHYGSLVTHSCDSGPEHEVVYVNQVGGPPLGDYSNVNTAVLALKSNRNISSVEQLRLWVKSGTTDSNSFPRLVQYLLQNTAGINPAMIDAQSFNAADSFCNANNLYYDGAITSRTNLRSFINSTAPFFLLNFAMRNGKMALIPALTNASSSAMFTEGNIIEESFSLEYLDVAERRPIRAEMIWRENLLNEFPRNRSFVVGDGASLETFDMSSFCTSEEHARKAGNYICAVRKFITHSITFKTTLDNANVTPGGVITVALSQTATSRFSNGSISGNGTVTSTSNMSDGNYNITYFKSGNESLKEASLSISNGRTTDTTLFNSIFSEVSRSSYSGLYIVERVELDEEGIVSISASEYPHNALMGATGGLVL